MSLRSLLIVAVILAPVLARAQTAPTSDFSPPPLVPSSPPPMPPLEPSAPPPAAPPISPGTPAPPGAYSPGQPQTGYQYSPYGQPNKPPEGPEVGLMVQESLFGMLTAAGTSVLPYFFMFVVGGLQSLDPTISSVLLLLIFGSVPLAVSSTEIGIANGSRFYYSESWPATLCGLAAEAAVLGIYYFQGWIPPSTASGGAPRAGGSVELLLIGSAVAVPLIEMIVINAFKQPKTGLTGIPLTRRDGPRLGLPYLSPLLVQTATGPSLGVNLGLVNVRF